MYFYILKAVLSLVLVCLNMKEWRDISFGILEDSRIAARCIHEFPFYGLEWWNLMLHDVPYAI